MNRERLSKLSKSRLIEMLLERDSAKSHDGLPVKAKAVIPAKFNPKLLTELSANKLEQMIQPKLTKPKSLVQLAAEKIEHAWNRLCGGGLSGLCLLITFLSIQYFLIFP